MIIFRGCFLYFVDVIAGVRCCTRGWQGGSCCLPRALGTLSPGGQEGGAAGTGVGRGAVQVDKLVQGGTAGATPEAGAGRGAGRRSWYVFVVVAQSQGKLVSTLEEKQNKKMPKMHKKRQKRQSSHTINHEPKYKLEDAQYDSHLLFKGFIAIRINVIKSILDWI